MKKVIFQKASREVIHAEDIGNFSIIGYQRFENKGFLVFDEGEQIWVGVSVAKVNVDDDKTSPTFSPSLVSRSAQLSGFLTMCHEEYPYTTFYKFSDMGECLYWLLHGESYKKT